MKKRLVVLSLLLSASGLSHAALTPYVGLGYEQQRIRINEVDFDTGQVMLHAGLWLWEGIGFELEQGLGTTDDTHSGVTLEHPKLQRYGVRLMTPPSENKTVLYVLFSGARSTLNMQRDNNQQPGEEYFDGYHAGIGLGTQITPRLQLDLSYNNYQIDESFDVSGIRLNIEFTLGAATR